MRTQRELNALAQELCNEINEVIQPYLRAGEVSIRDTSAILEDVLTKHQVTYRVESLTDFGLSFSITVHQETS